MTEIDLPNLTARCRGKGKRASWSALQGAGSGRPLQNELGRMGLLSAGVPDDPARLNAAAAANIRWIVLSVSRLPISIAWMFSGASMRRAKAMRALRIVDRLVIAKAQSLSLSWPLERVSMTLAAS